MDISHSSHVSHRHEDGWLTNHDEAAQARASACAGGRAREVSFRSVGNAGTVGNARRINGLQFPPFSQEVGNIEESGNSAPSKPTLPAALSPDEQAAFDERAGFLEFDCGLSRTEAEQRAFAEMHSDRSRSIRAMPGHDGLELWRAGVARLDPYSPPCPGYRSHEWPRVYERTLTFLDTFGQQAEALGWTASRLFGVHPKAGIVRVDACGALVLPAANPILAITATEIRFERGAYREKHGQPEGVPIWIAVRGASHP